MTLFFRNVASLLSEGDANGTWQRFIIIAAPQGPNNEGGPSSAPANGPEPDNYLHAQPVPEHRRPRARPRSARPATRPTSRAARLGNVPGNQGTVTAGRRANARAEEARSEARGGQSALHRFQAGLLALLVLAVGTYFAFAKDIPFTKPLRAEGDVRQRAQRCS